MSELYCDWCSDVELIDSPLRCAPCKKLVEDLQKEMASWELPIHENLPGTRAAKVVRVKK